LTEHADLFVQQDNLLQIIVDLVRPSRDIPRVRKEHLEGFSLEIRDRICDRSYLDGMNATVIVKDKSFNPCKHLKNLPFQVCSGKVGHPGKESI
jgi:hypothetical protein